MSARTQGGGSEKDAVGPDDDDVTIAARVARAIDGVPGATGLNNHQGSRATSDPRVVRAVLDVVGRRGLFFLDSRTTASSVGETEARRLRVSRLVLETGPRQPEAIALYRRAGFVAIPLFGEYLHSPHPELSLCMAKDL